MKKTIFLMITLLIFFSCNDDRFDEGLEISVPVSVQVIKKSSIEEFVTNSATVKAIKSAQIISEVAGDYSLNRNTRFNRDYRPGDLVNPTEEIIRLQNTEYENTIRIESQKLNLDISEREFEKQKSLYEKGGVTLRELKNSERSYIEAKYAYENALIQLSKLNITAPFKGAIVSLPYYTPGVRLEVGRPLLEIMDYSVLYGEISLAAKEIGNLSVGQKVRVTYYNAPDDTLHGKITSVSQALNPDTRTFAANFEVSNLKGTIRPGMLVRVETIVARKDSALVIPRDIILAKRRGKTVFTVEKGAAEERVISTGLENADFVEVIDGLKTNERLVIKGFETLRNRSKVKVVK